MHAVSVESLNKQFRVRTGLIKREPLHAVRDVSFTIEPGRTLGLVGESGCGKSTVARCLLRLIEPTSGRITVATTDVSGLGQRALRGFRANMQMVFQHPSESLNPRMTIRQSLREPLRFFLQLSRSDELARIDQALVDVGLDASYAARYPHQLSGGQQQRVAIARAIITRPRLIVLDEPTSALDVSVRGQILQVLLDLQAKYELAYLFISHDMSVVRTISHEVAVMYRGVIVERGPTATLFDAPLHPYAQALLAAVPIPDPRLRRQRLVLEGEVTSSLGIPAGCGFAERCPIKEPMCHTLPPDLTLKRAEHRVACHLVPPGVDSGASPTQGAS